MKREIFRRPLRKRYRGPEMKASIKSSVAKCCGWLARRPGKRAIRNHAHITPAPRTATVTDAAPRLPDILEFRAESRLFTELQRPAPESSLSFSRRGFLKSLSRTALVFSLEDVLRLARPRRPRRQEPAQKPTGNSRQSYEAPARPAPKGAPRPSPALRSASSSSTSPNRPASTSKPSSAASTATNICSKPPAAAPPSLTTIRTTGSISFWSTAGALRAFPRATSPSATSSKTIATAHSPT